MVSNQSLAFTILNRLKERKVNKTTAYDLSRAQKVFLSTCHIHEQVQHPQQVMVVVCAPPREVEGGSVGVTLERANDVVKIGVGM